MVRSGWLSHWSGWLVRCYDIACACKNDGNLSEKFRRLRRRADAFSASPRARWTGTAGGLQHHRLPDANRLVFNSEWVRATVPGDQETAIQAQHWRGEGIFCRLERGSVE